MRELSTAEVSNVSGGFVSPMELALAAGFIGLTVSYTAFTAKAVFSSAAATAGSPFALSGVALGLYCVGTAMGVGAAVGVGFMLVMGYTTSQQAYTSDTPEMHGHHCFG